MERDRDRFIGDAWQEMDEILEGLREGFDDGVNLDEHYDMGASEFVTYVAEELVMDEDDIERVREIFENSKCPYCVEENREKAMSGDVDDQRVDPTLGKHAWVDEEDGYRDDAGDLMTAYFAAKCENGHDDAFLLYEESWYADE